MLKNIHETTNYIQANIHSKPKIAIILGSGLNRLLDEMNVEITIPYNTIPHFPLSTVEGHEGCLVFGTLHGVEIVAMKGRFHYYEGYDMKQITFPIRIMKNLGIETLIISNASGGLNQRYEVGDIVLISDHINLFPEHPLRGKNESTLGVRFPDMSEVYDKELIQKVEHIAHLHAIPLKKGVYVGVSGPTYETPAEYKMYHILGGDCVGMSTVPEAIVARHAAMKCVGFSVITDMWRSCYSQEVTHEEVLLQAAKAEPTLGFIVTELVKQI
ncbi:MAG: purine-nucleoside phosphorylase [Bacteroidales bacterium]|jgi:purine-nucleoside phosphorylase|nr:purine-nucleoside phosphorylase [Bacteroidales bacterium]MDD2688476.1 purine-nucleoside phosphorylase [Bacteroidales bacterium]MDD3330830.1 purine-nucleoside phosphorylase [Bacteroidales bacterium]MDD3691046.1 purine-nucleoside phosphorylase [Bacteroidales bacterium]MDD4045165.1 purine-nucleoside phosphorylase [Bacteroidales bacterium]